MSISIKHPAPNVNFLSSCLITVRMFVDSVSIVECVLCLGLSFKRMMSAIITSSINYVQRLHSLNMNSLNWVRCYVVKN